MRKSIIAEGRTTTEAIEKGLAELKLDKSKVDIKVLEEEKRSFFSILAPRVVKVELIEKENFVKIEEKNRVEKRDLPREELDTACNQVKEFLEQIITKISSDNIKYNVNIIENKLFVNINGENVNFLIGHRGETLSAFQTILSSVASRGQKDRVNVILDIENYLAKRQKTLEELAEKIAKTVIRTKKSVTLEPMRPYERKIIHSKLQDNKYVKTHSIGIEPHRKVVISLK